MLLHSIEKGLSLPWSKGFFGEDKLNLIIKTYRSIQYNDANRWIQDYTAKVCQAYLAHLNQHGQAPSEFIRSTNQFVNSILDREMSKSIKGESLVQEVGRIPQWNHEQLISFFESRHSVRMFQKGLVPRKDLLAATRMAQSGPSACNRHPCKVHFVANGELMDKVLESQNGNRGFGTEFSHVAIVTFDLSSLLAPTERNQAWVEGGLFSMSLVLAFHAMGYGTCCLNWCADGGQEARLRATGIVNSRDCVVMLLGIGLLREDYTVAVSTRTDPEQVATFHS
jgi:hypothetical protein